MLCQIHSQNRSFEEHQRSFRLLSLIHIFLKNLLTKGELGESLRYPGRSVTDTIMTNSKVSAVPGGLALLIGLVIGVLLGIIAALNRNKWPDYLVMFIAIIGITVPVFVLAAVLQYVFTVKFQVLPTTGWGKPENIILPVAVMCLGTVSYTHLNP